jgi:hypothetical protein
LKKYMLRDVVGEKTKPCSALYSMIKNGVWIIMEVIAGV